ncbi:zinc finger MYM-type protein 1-like [Aphis craccivora]|uniref:Zinc finger MYM-type protein 1-like n=1 Tax=Aphis craccivora TaxID=307492 RepID=A0A6G0YH55_APHCR|nr:zinc finger MYM-type protein 1-like [Aphis craccivora]
MWWVKNWLCSTISQNCFSNLALLSIEIDLSSINNTIDSDTVLENF